MSTASSAQTSELLGLHVLSLRAFNVFTERFVALVPIGLVMIALEAALAFAFRGSLIGVGLAVCILLAATVILQGVVAQLVCDSELGRPRRSLAASASAVRPVIGPLLGASVLYAVPVALGSVFLLVPSVVLMCAWLVVAPVIVIEGCGVFDAFRRSRALTKGFWSWVVDRPMSTIAFGFVFGAAAALGAAVPDPDLRVVAAWIIGSLCFPMSAVGVTLAYVRLRILQGDPMPRPV